MLQLFVGHFYIWKYLNRLSHGAQKLNVLRFISNISKLNCIFINFFVHFISRGLVLSMLPVYKPKVSIFF